MKAPITYTGYNDKNECIATITGQDANNFLNPAEVKAAIDNVKTVMEEQLGNITKALREEVLEEYDYEVKEDVVEEIKEEKVEEPKEIVKSSDNYDHEESFLDGLKDLKNSLN